MLKKIVTLFCVVCSCYNVVAQIFEKDGVNYKVLNESDKKAVAVIGASKQQFLTILEIPAKVTYNNFSYDVTRVSEDAFKFSTSLTKVVLPNSVNEIASGAFMSCVNLKEINIPDSVINIGDYTFESCENLEKIFIPSSVKQIGNFAFARCFKLNGLWLGHSVAILGDEVFRECVSLTTVRIPDSVTYIGEDAFFNCNNLASITVQYTKPIPIGYFTKNINHITLKVPKGTALLFKNAPVWKEFGNIVEEIETAELALKF